VVLAEHPEVLGAAFYRMDEFFATVIPDQHYEFQQPAVGVEAEAEKSAWVLIVQGD
jgi:hypothetical protein